MTRRDTAEKAVSPDTGQTYPLRGIAPRRTYRQDIVCGRRLALPELLAARAIPENTRQHRFRFLDAGPQTVDKGGWRFARSDRIMNDVRRP